jgi:hypothetical protein
MGGGISPESASKNAPAATPVWSGMKDDFQKSVVPHRVQNDLSCSSLILCSEKSPLVETTCMSLKYACQPNAEPVRRLQLSQ